MKVLFTLVSLATAVQVVNAQSFNMVDTARTTYGESADYSLTNPVQIENNSGDTLPMAWERFNEVMPSQWDISSCTPINCMPIGITSGTYDLDPVNNLSDYHNCHFYPNNTPGTGQATMRIWNTQTLEEAFVTWYAFVGATGVGTVDQHNIMILSNPGKEVTIQGDFQTKPVDMRVFNTSGQIVKNKMYTGTNQIVLNDLIPGYYIVQLTSQDGLNFTEKVIITK